MSGFFSSKIQNLIIDEILEGDKLYDDGWDHVRAILYYYIFTVWKKIDLMIIKSKLTKEKDKDWLEKLKSILHSDGKMSSIIDLVYFDLIPDAA